MFVHHLWYVSSYHYFKAVLSSGITSLLLFSIKGNKAILSYFFFLTRSLGDWGISKLDSISISLGTFLYNSRIPKSQ